VSYLDVPRLHFAGKFESDPSTINNVIGSCCGGPDPPGSCAYDNLVTPTPHWNPDGRHHFDLVGCGIKSAVDRNGTVHTAASGDTIVGGTVEAFPVGRLVDLDPSFQFGSQVWGLGVRITTTTDESVTGSMAAATLRELWGRRTPDGFAKGLGGAYQSVLTNLEWSPPVGPFQSGVLGWLTQSSRLSIRLACYAYNDKPATPGFRQGQIVGTIGPSAPSEPDHGVSARRLVHGGTYQSVPMSSAAFNAAPFKVDAARGRLVLDLANAIPELTPAGERAPALSPMHAEIVDPTGAAPTERIPAAIPIDRPRFLQRAGIEELAVTPAQVAALGSRFLRLVTATGAGGTLRLAESAGAVDLQVSDTVVRLNPGESKDLTVFVTAHGDPLAAADVHIAPSRPGRALTALSVRTGAGAAVPLPGRVTTDANGMARLRLVAGDPGHPRTHIDGAVSFVGLFVNSVAQANKRAEIAVRVFDRHTIPAAPALSDVEPIFRQYSRLYPSMRNIVDLADHARVRQWAPALAASLRRPEAAPNHMPVTRDLSRDKRALLIKWLDAGAP
jgi:hypothetical protein